ncbi:MAG: FHA domain-containing protein [Candidatus Hydrogenedentes bacterium]|nr:FHA domain-containing protein [Candidatus Hydrogenedentota bacterium]
MPQLIVEQKGLSTQTIPLSDREIILGRANDCDVILLAEEISRHHAKISYRDGKYIIQDLRSLNGTYVNRQRVVEHLLSHMDEIYLGSKCRIIFRDDTQYGRSKSEFESTIVTQVEQVRKEIENVQNTLFQVSNKILAREERLQEIERGFPKIDIRQLSRAYRRLDALYKASQIMGSAQPIDSKLEKFLELVIEVVGAERGFILLHEERRNALLVKAVKAIDSSLDASSPSMGIAGKSAIDGEPILLNDTSLDSYFSGRESIVLKKIKSAMSAPVKMEDRILGSIYVDTIQNVVRFDEEDLELLCSLGSQIAFAVENARLNEKMLEEERKRQSFKRFLPDPIVEKILKEGSSLKLGGERKTVATLFCDIRSFSQIAEKMPPQELIDLLNEHFTAITEIIFAWGGTLDKYIGDEIMALFGTPISTGDDAYSAVCAGLDILKRNDELNYLRNTEDKPILQVGIGIEMGEVVAGFVGSPMRMEYTVVGDKVNIAKRLCDIARPGKVVVGEEVWKFLKGRLVGSPVGSFKIKGRDQPIIAYEVNGLA